MYKPVIDEYADGSKTMTIEIDIRKPKKKVHSQSFRTITKIIEPVDSKFGAPMGRPNIGTRPGDKRVYDCAVPMVASGDYDKGGAYWGTGKQLRVRYTRDLSFIQFYRRES